MSNENAVYEYFISDSECYLYSSYCFKSIEQCLHLLERDKNLFAGIKIEKCRADKVTAEQIIDDGSINTFLADLDCSLFDAFNTSRDENDEFYTVSKEARDELRGYILSWSKKYINFDNYRIYQEPSEIIIITEEMIEIYRKERSCKCGLNN